MTLLYFASHFLCWE